MSSDSGTTSEAREVRTTRLPASAAASAHARNFVVTTLRGWQVGSDALDDAELLVSELVTNALVHGGAEEVAVALSDHGEALLLEVTHRETTEERRGPLEPLTVGADDTHGRGLTIVDVLAAAWGVDEADDTRRVWARLVATRTGVVPPGEWDDAVAGLAAAVAAAGAGADVDHALATWSAAWLLTAFAGVAVLEPPGDDEPHLRYVTPTSMPGATRVWARFPVAMAGPAAAAYRRATPLFHESRSAVVAGFPGLGPSVQQSELAAFAHLPLLREGVAFGVLALSWAHGRVLDAEDRRRLVDVTAVVAAALVRVGAAGPA